MVVFFPEGLMLFHILNTRSYTDMLLMMGKLCDVVDL